MSCQEKDQPLVTDWGKERVSEMYEKVRTVTVHSTFYTLNSTLYTLHSTLYTMFKVRTVSLQTSVAAQAKNLQVITV